MAWLRTGAWALPLLALAWLGVLAGISLVSDAAPAAVVILPSEALLTSLPGTVSVLGSNAWSVTLSSDAPRFAKALYDLGAYLVLPAGLPGCLPLPRPAP